MFSEDEDDINLESRMYHLYQVTIKNFREKIPKSLTLPTFSRRKKYISRELFFMVLFIKEERLIKNPGSCCNFAYSGNPKMPSLLKWQEDPEKKIKSLLWILVLQLKLCVTIMFTAEKYQSKRKYRDLIFQIIKNNVDSLVKTLGILLDLFVDL